jgi:hypothetical protein
MQANIEIASSCHKKEEDRERRNGCNHYDLRCLFVGLSHAVQAIAKRVLPSLLILVLRHLL